MEEGVAARGDSVQLHQHVLYVVRDCEFAAALCCNAEQILG